MTRNEHKLLKSALASTKMEGFRVTEQTEDDCKRLLAKEISTSDLVHEIINRSIRSV